MSFQSGLSGLNASTKNLDIIGNNVANANTAGFKGSRAVFGDVYASSLSGAGASNVGIGTKIAEVQQEFTQGNISVTNNPLDVAINGKGFFRFENDTTTTYSRNGQLHVDALGYIVNSDKLKLTGYPVDATNNIIASEPAPLRLTTSDLQPRPTSVVQTASCSRMPSACRTSHNAFCGLIFPSASSSRWNAKSSSIAPAFSITGPPKSNARAKFRGSVYFCETTVQECS